MTVTRSRWYQSTVFNVRIMLGHWDAYCIRSLCVRRRNSCHMKIGSRANMAERADYICNVNVLRCEGIYGIDVSCVAYSTLYIIHISVLIRLHRWHQLTPLLTPTADRVVVRSYDWTKINLICHSEIIVLFMSYNGLILAVWLPYWVVRKNPDHNMVIDACNVVLEVVGWWYALIQSKWL